MIAKDSLNRAVDVAFARLACEGYGALTPAQRTLACVWSACGEIENGGFDQYFFNTSGDWAMETEQAFRAIGADELASIVRAAIEVFPGGGPSRDVATRHQQLDDLSPESVARLTELGARFDGRGVDRLLATFVEQNLEEVLRETDA